MNNYIDINIRELIDNCCDDKQIFLDNMNSLKDKYNKKVHNLTSYTPFSTEEVICVKVCLLFIIFKS